MSTPSNPLDPRLQRAFEQLKKTSARDPQDEATGRANFMAQARTLKNVVVTPKPRRSFLPSFPKGVSFATAAVTALVSVLLFGGAGTTVYAAQESLPNSSLYPVKTLSEDARLLIAAEPQTKLDLLLEFIQRRVSEITELNARQVAPPDIVEKRLQDHIDEAVSLSADLPDADKSQALERVLATIQKQQATLAAVQARVAVPAKPVIQRVQEMLQAKRSRVETGLQDPASLPKTGNGKVPPGLERETAPPGKGGQPATLTPGDQRRSTTTPPGLEHRPTGVPGESNSGKGK